MIYIYIYISLCYSNYTYLTSSWNTSKPTPKYTIYIFECDNFSFTCKSCNVNNKTISLTSLSTKFEKLNNKFDTRNESMLIFSNNNKYIFLN